MTEVTLNEPVIIEQEEKRHIYVLMNEKGQYLKKGNPYWTTDLNKCLSEIRNYDTQVRNARSLLNTRKQIDSGETKCFNQELYLGFEKIFIQEVDVKETKND